VACQSRTLQSIGSKNGRRGVNDLSGGGRTSRKVKVRSVEKEVRSVEEQKTKTMYGRFAAMITTSTVVMYGLMYLNTLQWDHVRFSETRTYMAVLMGAAMAIVMLSFMLKMHSDRRINAAIFVGGAVVFSLALWLVRSQTTVDDVAYMKGMIPHHSIAILTSQRARISDPRVRKLADQIIDSQQREIAEMEALIKDLEQKR
jgi:uncharacterized protein (DUF305 family)